MSKKVKITITHSNCCSGFHKEGDEYIIDDTICPPICMELWHRAFPYVWALANGAEDDTPDDGRGTYTDVICPDQGRVHMHIEALDEEESEE